MWITQPPARIIRADPRRDLVDIAPELVEICDILSSTRRSISNIPLKISNDEGSSLYSATNELSLVAKSLMYGSSHLRRNIFSFRIALVA